MARSNWTRKIQLIYQLKLGKSILNHCSHLLLFSPKRWLLCQVALPNNKPGFTKRYTHIYITVTRKPHIYTHWLNMWGRTVGTNMLALPMCNLLVICGVQQHGENGYLYISSPWLAIMFPNINNHGEGAFTQSFPLHSHTLKWICDYVGMAPGSSSPCFLSACSVNVCGVSVFHYYNLVFLCGFVCMFVYFNPWILAPKGCPTAF